MIVEGFALGKFCPQWGQFYMLLICLAIVDVSVVRCAVVASRGFCFREILSTVWTVLYIADMLDKLLMLVWFGARWWCKGFCVKVNSVHSVDSFICC